jgi:teichuronic acid biosynthesis glycosyltransferase TuaC
MEKVLIFSLAYFPKHVGGAEVSIKEITDRIPDIEFHLVCNRFDSTLPKEEKIGNVFVHRIGITTANPSMADLKKLPLAINKPLYQFLAAWAALRLHRKYKFDAIWAMMAHSTGVPAAIFKIFHPEVGYVLNLQEGDPPEYIERKMRPVWPLFKRAFTSADIIQPLSTFLAKWARARGFTGPIEIIPNAVAADYFAQIYPEEELERTRAKLGKKPGDVFVVTTSRLVTKNAVDDVIRAMAKLPENVHFVVYGTGPDETMLKKLIAELKLQNRVHMLGQLGHKEMPLMLQACDIFIRPSRSEGFGASFAEAMAAGLPVIATQEGGIADFLFDEKRNPDKSTTGWAVDKDSPEQIAAAVRDIIARPEKVREVVANAKKMVFEKYDWDIIARDMREKVFTTLFAK